MDYVHSEQWEKLFKKTQTFHTYPELIHCSF